MAKFSKKSLQRLSECHPYLQLLCNELVKVYDVTIIEGHRTKEKQENYYSIGKSKLRFPDSKHNKQPSMAIDLAPFPVDWDDLKRFYYMAGIVKGIASQLHIDIRWGGDWDNDGDFKDQSFNDLVHIELI